MSKRNLEDIMLWSDGTWCYRYEVEEMTHMSDDYEILYMDSPMWIEIMKDYIANP